MRDLRGEHRVASARRRAPTSARSISAGRLRHVRQRVSANGHRRLPEDALDAQRTTDAIQGVGKVKSTLASEGTPKVAVARGDPGTQRSSTP